MSECFETEGAHLLKQVELETLPRGETMAWKSYLHKDLTVKACDCTPLPRLYRRLCNYYDKYFTVFYVKHLYATFLF